MKVFVVSSTNLSNQTHYIYPRAFTTASAAWDVAKRIEAKNTEVNGNPDTCYVDVQELDIDLKIFAIKTVGDRWDIDPSNVSIHSEALLDEKSAKRVATSLAKKTGEDTMIYELNIAGGLDD
jgi:hypothetical protein